jgi:hypothetical protein
MEPGRERRPDYKPLSLVSASVTKVDKLDLDYRQEYRIEARIGGRAWLDSLQANVPSLVEEVQRSMRRAVVEQVFGEFREPLARLTMAILSHETEEAAEIVRDIRHTMFDVE